jgi:hypothetical protein
LEQWQKPGDPDYFSFSWHTQAIAESSSKRERRCLDSAGIHLMNL